MVAPELPMGRPTLLVDEVGEELHPPGHPHGSLPGRVQLVPSDMAPAHSVRKHILHGYRPLITDARGILASLLYLHNESGNIYTHAVAFLISVALAIRHFFWLEIPMTAADIIMSAAFFAGLLCCYGLSTYYHLQCCNRLSVFQCALACDLIGIVACILGSFYIGLWTGFECDPKMRAIYMAVVVAESIPLFLIASHHKLRDNTRVVVPVFAVVVASGIVPTLHFTFTSTHPAKQIMMLGIYGMFLLYGCGVVFYVLAFPECCAPGRFDYFFSSHQIWHVFVFLAPLAEYFAAVHAMGQSVACLR